jgi:hypothetical protein
VHASDHKVLVTGQPSDHELCIGLMSRLPVGYRTMYVTLMGHQDLQEMSGDGKDKGNSETKPPALGHRLTGTLHPLN